MELDNLPDQTKYYIPTIEEFHVGFDYEIWEKKLVYDKVWKFRVNKYMFNEKHVTQVFFNYNFIEDLKEEKIRVKYLDREDIESLDFKYLIKNHYTTHSGDGYIINTFDFDNTIIISYGDIHDSDTIFRGIVKNKSELKKLLKQLQIE